MAKFWQLLAESVITQAMITLLLVITICYLFVMGREVPALLGTLCGSVLGFWFGTKTQYQLDKRVKGNEEWRTR